VSTHTTPPDEPPATLQRILSPVILDTVNAQPRWHNSMQRVTFLPRPA